MQLLVLARLESPAPASVEGYLAPYSTATQPILSECVMVHPCRPRPGRGSKHDPRGVRDEEVAGSCSSKLAADPLHEVVSVHQRSGAVQRRDHGARRVCNRAVASRGAVLIDQGRIHAQMAHPAHQLPCRRTAHCRQVVARMAQVVDMDPRQTPDLASARAQMGRSWAGWRTPVGPTNTRPSEIKRRSAPSPPRRVSSLRCGPLRVGPYDPAHAC